MTTTEKVARKIAEWACMSHVWEEYFPKAAAIDALYAEDRRELVKALSKCALFLSGTEVSKSALVEALELARAALAKEGSTP